MCPALFAALRRVTVRDIGAQDDAALAARIAASPQALCVVNQRAHARALFRAIRDQPGARHLSTCMHSRPPRAGAGGDPRRPQGTGRSLPGDLHKPGRGGCRRGLSIGTARLGGLDQIAQAAGRCNREFGRRPEESEVLVFASPDYGVIQPLKTNAQCGAEMLKLHPNDPFAPSAIHAFFEMLERAEGQA